MSLQPGARLGPYEILSTIGAGGMGEVYRCRDTRVPRTIVALKVLAPPVADDPAFRRRFAREARIIAELDHPHICALYDVGEHEGAPYIVMPMLDGQSLAGRLRSGAIPAGEALRIAIAVASALAHAHERGVLHRDVKPSNIMLGSDGSVKLVDFGIARTIKVASPIAATGSGRLTDSGHLLGTLDYMSPEQLSGGTLDERSDIFSLGVVLYEMLAGRHPFRSDLQMFTACAILDCEYPPIGSSDPVVQGVETILVRALAREPEQRDASMAEFLAELEIARTCADRLSDGGGARVAPPLWNARRVGAAFAATAAFAMLGLALVSGLAGSRAGGGAVSPAPSAGSGVLPPVIAARPAGLTGPAAPGYRRIGASAPADAAGPVAEIGVTLWRLRPAAPHDQVRLLVHQPGAAAEEWAAERVELTTPLAAGDRVRISVESPRPGYLYVVDRERYADGSTGVPHVIFPTSHLRQGDNRLASGRLVDIPSQSDRPPYFTLRPSRADQTAELLTLIVADQPVPELTAGAGTIQLSQAVIEQLERRGSPALVEHLELAGGAGQSWTNEEQLAASDVARVLTQDAPAPQTVFRIVTSEPGFLVAQVMLRHAHKK